MADEYLHCGTKDIAPVGGPDEGTTIMLMNQATGDAGKMDLSTLLGTDIDPATLVSRN